NGVLAIHYFTWYARIGDSHVIGMLQAVFYIGALAGVCFWLLVSRYTEKKTICRLAIFATALLMALATLVVGPGSLSGTGNAFPLMVGHALAGLTGSALWVIPSSMVADIIDQDDLSTGHRREGVFFGILNFGEKIGAGASLLIAGILLDYYVKLVPG